MEKNNSEPFLHWVRGGVAVIWVLFLVFILSISFLPSDLKQVYAREAGSIYLNGETGDDENDGMSEENAVKTFEKAKELAEADLDIKKIYINGTVDISGEISLGETNAILMRNPGFRDHLLRVKKGETATLKDITVDGGGENDRLTLKSLLLVDGDLNITDGTVLENNIVLDLDNWHVYGGAIYTDRYKDHKRTINMTGGIIRNNSAHLGGGIYLGKNTVLNLSGGVIEGNKAYIDRSKTYDITNCEAGGGICTYQSSTINLSGDAVISGNSATECGGGISLGSYEPYGGLRCTLNMTGGVIKGNKAGSAGGGIFVQTDNRDNNGSNIANISAGEILNNEMTGLGVTDKMFGGGGIYVNGLSQSLQGVLNLKNALITDNEASEAGGGYASCPVSTTNIFEKDGIAIYGNRAKLGQDIDIESGIFGYGLHGGFPPYTISPVMLGGTPYRWKDNDNNEVPLTRLTGVLDALRHQTMQLHTDVTEDSQAESLAKVIIKGNKSTTRGGGIGSNGGLVAGQKEVTNIKVTKLWKYDEAENRPESITVELYRKVEEDPDNPIFIGTGLMREENGSWELNFENLPKRDENGKLYRYTIKEQSIEGYAVQLSGNQNNGYTLTNIPETTVQVEKKWNGDPTNQVEISLLSDGTVKEKAIITAADDWKHIFTNLPKFDAEDGHVIRYEVKETPINGYTSLISGDATSGYLVTNTKDTTPPGPNPPSPDPYTPPSPVTPGRPVNPVPSTPSTPSTPTSPNPNTPTVAGVSRPNPVDVVENDHVPTVLGESRPPVRADKRGTLTEDSSRLPLWASLFTFSVLAFVFYTIVKKERQCKLYNNRRRLRGRR